MAFQYPVAIPGLTFSSFLRAALNARHAPSAGVDGKVPTKKGIPPKEFRELMRSKMAMLKMDDSFASRYLNDGFSGGEKKRAEILQMAVLRPEIAIMDETDSGLDIDALKIVSEGVNALTGPGPGRAGDHALQPHPQLHQAAPRPRHDRRAHRHEWRRDTRAASSRPRDTTGSARR
jgi:Fe-S cluster assembly ATP-binding protein